MKSKFGATWSVTRVTRLCAAGVLGLVVSGVLLAWLEPVRGSVVSTSIAAEFCAIAPAEARAGPADAAAVQLSAAVPPDSALTTDADFVPVAATQGDVVRVTVASPREGGVAVHGLLDVRPIAARDRVTVEFRAIYSGRFPIHFHGADGSHLQIAAIEVAPRALPLQARK
jgi:hypothetical protein